MFVFNEILRPDDRPSLYISVSLSLAFVLNEFPSCRVFNCRVPNTSLTLWGFFFYFERVVLPRELRLTRVCFYYGFIDGILFSAVEITMVLRGCDIYIVVYVSPERAFMTRTIDS